MIICNPRSTADAIAASCPLTEWPAATIAGMEATIRVLREPVNYSFAIGIMNLVATLLKTNLRPDGQSLIISYIGNQGQVHDICLNLHEILCMDFCSITFVANTQKFTLNMNSPFSLTEQRGDLEIRRELKIA